jgi:YbbR domain-containing protein
MSCRRRAPDVNIRNINSESGKDGKRMRDKILEHPGLKIASLILAFLLWLVIINFSDPVIKRTYTNIPVTVSNVSYIESLGMSYQVVDGFDTVSVTVKGNRSVIDSLSPSSIKANADLTQIVSLSSDPVMVPVTVSIAGVPQDSISVNPSNIEITLEDMESKSFVINATAGDTTPANGYEVASLTASPDTVTIRGGKSLVDKIDKVMANVDVSNMSADGTLNASLSVYDKNGDVLDNTQMSYLTFSVDESEVAVSVTLNQVLSDVKVRAETYGSPADGYQVGSVSVTPSTLSVVGDAASLAAFKADGGEIDINSASRAVDVSGASSDVEIKVDISDYLPDGISLESDLTDTVVVSVKILPDDSQSYELSTKNITVSNLGAGLNAVFADQTLDIRVKGSKSSLESLTAAQITAAVDLSGKSAGTYKVPVSVTLPDGYSLVEDVTAEITISKTTTAGQTGGS